jgi:hypothetical protein
LDGCILCTLGITSYNDMAQLLWHSDQTSHYIDSNIFSGWPSLHQTCDCFPHVAPL